MLKLLLPVVLVTLLISGGLIWWRFSVSKTLEKPTTAEVKENVEPVEVPKTLPDAPIEDKVKTLEESVDTLVSEINNLKKSSSSQTNGSLDSRLKSVEAQVTELKVKVSNLETATPAPTAASTTTAKPTVYIPLGAGGSWGAVDWYTLPEYEVSMNPDNFSGYSGMELEVTFRLVESAGTGSVRLYNVTDQTVTSSQLDITSTSFGLKTSSSFKLPAGTKTYRLQVKSSQGKDLFIQLARIRVNF